MYILIRNQKSLGDVASNPLESKKSFDDDVSNPLESKNHMTMTFPTPWKAKILGR